MTFQPSQIASKRLRAFFAGIVLAIGTLSAAHAQNILVINEETILTESQVGQHIASQLEVIGREIQTELEAAAQPLTQENEALQAETSALSQEAIQQRPDLMQRIEALNQQAQQFELARRARQQEIVQTERQAMRPIYDALGPILEAVVEERGIDILVDRANLVFASPDVDISDEVITRLNQEVPTVTVTRVPWSTRMMGPRDR